MSRPGLRADEPLRRQRIRDRALVLPLVGLVLLMPPVAAIFEIPVRVAGIPFALLYLFGAWAMLIVCGALLARALRGEQEGAGGGATPDPARDAAD